MYYQKKGMIEVIASIERLLMSDLTDEEISEKTQYKVNPMMIRSLRDKITSIYELSYEHCELLHKSSIGVPYRYVLMQDYNHLSETSDLVYCNMYVHRPSYESIKLIPVKVEKWANDFSTRYILSVYKPSYEHHSKDFDDVSSHFTTNPRDFQIERLLMFKTKDEVNRYLDNID